MALRIVIRTDDAGMAANVGGSVLTEIKTFDIEAPEVERFLTAIHLKALAHRQVVGVEVVDLTNGAHHAHD